MRANISVREAQPAKTAEDRTLIRDSRLILETLIQRCPTDPARAYDQVHRLKRHYRRHRGRWGQLLRCENTLTT